MNLSGSMVASSFGKLVMKEHPREGVKEEDLAIALLMMITNNIGENIEGSNRPYTLVDRMIRSVGGH